MYSLIKLSRLTLYFGCFIKFNDEYGTGQNFIGEIELNTFNETGPVICATGTEQSPVYNGVVPGIGSATVYKTLFDLDGTEFIPMTERPYSVNVLFVVNQDGFSLSQNGSINEFFPSATGFAFNYGLVDDEEPAYAVGLYVPDDNGIVQTYLREFDVTTTNGNTIQVNFNNNFYYSSIPGPNDEQNLITITDEIFANGEIFASGVPLITTLTVFRLYNPCNGYEFYLVQ